MIIGICAAIYFIPRVFDFIGVDITPFRGDAFDTWIYIMGVIIPALAGLRLGAEGESIWLVILGPVIVSIIASIALLLFSALVGLVMVFLENPGLNLFTALIFGLLSAPAVYFIVILLGVD